MIDNKCTILATMWFSMQDDQKFRYFRQENDIHSPFSYRDDEEFRGLLEKIKPGLMAAYLIDTQLIKPSRSAIELVEVSYDSLAKFLGVAPNTEFETFREMIQAGK